MEIVDTDLFKSYTDAHNKVVDDKKLNQKKLITKSTILKHTDEGLQGLKKRIGKAKSLAPHNVIDIGKGGFQKPLFGLHTLFLNHEIPVEQGKELIKKYNELNGQRKGFRKLTRDQKVQYLNNLKQFNEDLINEVSDDILKRLNTSRKELIDVVNKRVTNAIESQKAVGKKEKKITAEKDKKIENLKDETDLAVEELEKAEDKLIKARKQGFLNKEEEDDVKITIDESKKSNEDNKKKVERIDIKPSPEEEEEETERRITRIEEAQQRDQLLQKISEQNDKRLGQITNVGKQAIIGTSVVGLIGTLAPYVPKTFQAIRGVPMKKKRTKEDLILLQQTGIDKQKLNDQKRTIDSLNRRLDNNELQNRERTINKITNIGQQNRFNRVAINNIRGKRINVKNRIKMHNITKRKFFNV